MAVLLGDGGIERVLHRGLELELTATGAVIPASAALRFLVGVPEVGVGVRVSECVGELRFDFNRLLLRRSATGVAERSRVTFKSVERFLPFFLVVSIFSSFRFRESFFIFYL